MPNGRRAARRLLNLPDGDYKVPVDVPYIAQFASPTLIHAYIHDHLHGRDDPNWQSFGAADSDTYTFWAHRACAIVCLKMVIDAYHTSAPQTIWQLIEEGLRLDGYRTFDENRKFVDQGWFYPALVKLSEQHGLQVRGLAYASALDVCSTIREGWSVAAAVTPDLGERGQLRRYDGHFVLVYGFGWQAGRCTVLRLHNPSGRFPELQQAAVIPIQRFRAAFAHRFIAFRPA